jgi:serine phosphatase RsbU (regulator of sigma subunit)
MSGEHYPTTSFALATTDRLVLLTDGVHEQPSSSNERFGLERLLQTLSQSQAQASDVDTIVAELNAFSGLRFEDDVTILTIERT